MKILLIFVLCVLIPLGCKEIGQKDKIIELQIEIVDLNTEIIRLKLRNSVHNGEKDRLDSCITELSGAKADNWNLEKENFWLRFHNDGLKYLVDYCSEYLTLPDILEIIPLN